MATLSKHIETTPQFKGLLSPKYESIYYATTATIFGVLSVLLLTAMIILMRDLKMHFAK